MLCKKDLQSNNSEAKNYKPKDQRLCIFCRQTFFYIVFIKVKNPVFVYVWT